MADKKDDDVDVTDTDETVGEDGDDSGNDDADLDSTDTGEAGWTRMQEMIENTVRKELGAWSALEAKKSRTSTRSPKPPVKKTVRKKGFLSGQFFSGLSDEE